MALLCLSMLASSISSITAHAPAVQDILQQHAQEVADHGHSHGLEADLYWLFHGHSHDAADHDHNPADLARGPSGLPTLILTEAWQPPPSPGTPAPLFLLDRPPRA